MIEVEVPNMGIVEFPDDTHPDVIMGALAKASQPVAYAGGDINRSIVNPVVPRSGLELAAQNYAGQQAQGMKPGLIDTTPQDVLRAPGQFREFLGAKLLNAPEQIGRNLQLLPRYQETPFGSSNTNQYQQKPMRFQPGESLIPGEPNALKGLATGGLLASLVAPPLGLSYLTDIIAGALDVPKELSRQDIPQDEKNRQLMNNVAMLAAPFALHGAFSPATQIPPARVESGVAKAEVSPEAPPSVSAIPSSTTPVPSFSTQDHEQATGFTAKPVFDTAGMSPELIAQMPKQDLHLTDLRPGSPTEGLSIVVPEGSDPAAVKAAIDTKVQEGYTAPQTEEPKGPAYPLTAIGNGKFVDQSGVFFDAEHQPWQEPKETANPVQESINAPLVGEPSEPVVPQNFGMADKDFRHAVAASLNGAGQLKDLGAGELESVFKQKIKDLALKANQNMPLDEAHAGLKALNKEMANAVREKKQGKVYSGVPALDPGEKGPSEVAKGLWDKGSLFTTQAVKFLGERFPQHNTPISSEQAVNTVRNKLGAESVEWKILKDAGIEKALPEKATPREVATWINNKGPKVEVHSYGMEGKSQGRTAALVQHEFETRFGSRYRIVNEHGAVDEAGKVIPAEQVTQPEARTMLLEYRKLYKEGKLIDNTGPKATSAYEHVSAFDTKEKMPDWTVSKEGRNLQRVDVVVPQEKKYPFASREELQKNKTLWAADNLHENLPNTLGWAQIQYKTGKNGEKIAFIGEAQSRWGQEQREAAKIAKGSGERTGIPNHPLLRDYNRLILKAAIEQARKEGATHIVVSDAETAMMTEGHDAHATYDDGDINKVNGAYIPQETGMRLNYDTILPKIAEELTGSKGEKVSLGEHKNAFKKPHNNEYDAQGNQIYPDEQGRMRLASPIIKRSNLIFRNPDGSPKTDASGIMYLLGKAGERLTKGEPMTLTGKTYTGIPGLDPGDLNPVEMAKKVLGKVKETVDPIKELMSGENLKAFRLKQAGYDAPKTMAADPNAADSLVAFAQSQGAGRAIARSAVTDVLGDKQGDVQFRKQLGAVIYEDMRRAAGRIGNPVTDIANSPFASEAQYRAALANPEIQAALQRHKDLVQDMAEEQHTKLGGQLAKPGEETGAFANMRALINEESFRGGPGSGQMNTMTKGSAFSKPRAFTGSEYEFDYRNLGERMIEKNYSEVKKQELYEGFHRAGLGKILKKGQSVPEGFTGVPVQRRQLLITKPGEKPTWVNQNETFAVKNNVLPEFQQAFQTDSKLVKGALGHLADLVTKAQVQLGVDAGFHSVNDFAALNGALRTQLGKNVIGVKEFDTINLFAKNAKRALENNADFQRELAEMSKAGVTIRENVTQADSKAGRALRFVDTTTRVAMNQLFNDMVAKGWVKDLPAERRRFINGALGQYNPRLMTRYQQFFQQSGISPFIVAGKNFNRLAVQRLIGSPGVKGADMASATKMRALQLASLVVAGAVVPSVVNYLANGKIQPDGTKFGEIKVGKLLIDPLKWMGVRRGLRITGLQAAMDSKGSGQDLTQTGIKAARDIGRGLVHPYAGPAVNAATDIGLSLESGQGFGLKKAATELNPTISAAVQSAQQGEGKTKGLTKMLGSMVGVRTQPKDRQLLMSEARVIARQHDKPDIIFPPSEYLGLIGSLKNGEVAKAKENYQELVEKKGVKTVEGYFKNYPSRTYTGKQEWDKELEAKQPELYQRVREEDKAVADLFFQQVIGQEGVPLNLKHKRQSFKDALGK